MLSFCPVAASQCGRSAYRMISFSLRPPQHTRVRLLTTKTTKPTSGRLTNNLVGHTRALHSTNCRFNNQQQQQSNNSPAPPPNEPILDYLNEDEPTSREQRRQLELALDELQSTVSECPIVIGGKEYKSDEVRYQRMPFDHKQQLAKFYYASHELIQQAADVAAETRREWDLWPMERRLAIFERAAELISGKYRARLNAATMLGQGKTIKQAEIDSAAELCDFFRLNSHYMRNLLIGAQPTSTKHEHNELQFRSLDGFVAAISPFNFTAIAGNLLNAPALSGNCLVWKPSDTAILSNYMILKILQEAGLPDGVVNFVPSEGLDFGRLITANRQLAGINFTGSLATFQWLWSEVGLNIKRYQSFPRLVGECGGKNYHLIHKSVHLETAVAQTVRSAFEYSGQKCSACSRLYVPASLWESGFRDQLIALMESGKLKVGPVTDFSSYLSAVIDGNSFKRCANYIEYAKAIEQQTATSSNKSSGQLRILSGGKYSDQVGYFIEPTLIETKDPRNRLMVEEIFGPILTCYVYPDSELDKTMELIDENPFALTGAIFGQDEQFIEHARCKLRMSAGNFYINDKSTGAVVGQQPFGGSRHSGTNDKAGGPYNLIRWCNQQTIKRTSTNLVDI